MILKRFRFACLAAGFLCSLAGTSHAFQLGQRWIDTATDPPTNIQGAPMTITWSFAPDGTTTDGGGPSNLVSFLDTIIGAGPGGSDLTQRPWFPAFNTSFNRWGQISGNTYIYEPADDGVAQTLGNIGILGVRGDVRVAGRVIDGQGGVLAFNNFPQFGDMVIDTGDSNFYSNTTNNRRNLRNVLMHEHGHGMGLFHVESNTSGFLMEPFIQTNFDGPQMDDILGAQRHYGDFLERAGGNNTSATATPFGLIAPGGSVVRGTHAATGTIVLQTETDFLSIDDDSDLDFFSFAVGGPSTVSLTLTPLGPTYNQGPQGGGQTSFNAAQQSNLTLALLDTNGTTVMDVQNVNGLGGIEMITNFPLANAGTYFARITGAQNAIQMYQLNVSVLVPEPALGLAALGAGLIAFQSWRRRKT